MFIALRPNRAYARTYDMDTALNLTDTSETTRRSTGLRAFYRRKNRALFLMFAPAIAFFVLFRYVPMAGLMISFQDYNLRAGMWGSEWVGLRNFRLLFQNPSMALIIRNTFVLSVTRIIVNFPVPIMLAILLNEVRHKFFRKSVQTILYLPHFLNWVIIGGLVFAIFAADRGSLNLFIERLGGEKTPFLYNTGSWLAIYFGSGVWKEMGWRSIIYLAALSGIDPGLYESASIDGATKLQQIFRITIPSIVPTMVILLILSVERVMEVGFDQIYVLSNAAVSRTSQVISTFSYSMAQRGTNFGVVTAMGFFESLVGLILVVTVNRVARGFRQGLW